MYGSNRLLKKLRLPFDKLRANGAGIKIIRIYPFMVSLSNHKKIAITIWVYEPGV
jgi:hypothetical protein